MRKVYWTLFVIYLLIDLQIGKFRFERLKKKMTDKEIDEYAQQYVARQARRIMRVTGAKINVVGAENLPEGTCLFVSNHQEYFDIPVMLGYVNKPTGFIAKKELSKVPGLNYWMEQIHCVFIDREDTRESMKSILQGIENLKNGYTMQICPEGTRSKGPALGEFKKGSMKLALKAGVPVVPVTMNNVYKITNGKGFFNVRSASMDVIISKPIFVQDLSKEEQNNLSETVRYIIQENLNK